MCSLRITKSQSVSRNRFARHIVEDISPRTFHVINFSCIDNNTKNRKEIIAIAIAFALVWALYFLIVFIVIIVFVIEFLFVTIFPLAIAFLLVFAFDLLLPCSLI